MRKIATQQKQQKTKRKIEKEEKQKLGNFIKIESGIAMGFIDFSSIQ